MTSSALDVLQTDLDTVVDWVTTHQAGGSLHLRLTAWAWSVGLSLDPANPEHRQAAASLRQAVAARIIHRALADAGWTFDQLATDRPWEPAA